MTTFLDAVQALLAPLAPGGTCYGVNDTLLPGTDGYPLPYITWQRIVSTDNVSLEGPSGLQWTRIQVDYFARRIKDAEALRVAGDAALANLPQSVPVSRQDLYEEPVKLWRITRDYSVPYDESQT